jgi:hypothetical protein
MPCREYMRCVEIRRRMRTFVPRESKNPSLSSIDILSNPAALLLASTTAASFFFFFADRPPNIESRSEAADFFCVAEGNAAPEMDFTPAVAPNGFAPAAFEVGGSQAPPVNVPIFVFVFFFFAFFTAEVDDGPSVSALLPSSPFRFSPCACPLVGAPACNAAAPDCGRFWATLTIPLRAELAVVVVAVATPVGCFPTRTVRVGGLAASTPFVFVFPFFFLAEVEVVATSNAEPTRGPCEEEVGARVCPLAPPPSGVVVAL